MDTVAAPWDIAARHGAQGFVTELEGGPVHWVRWNATGGSSGDPILLVHGLGGSILNWTLVGRQLAVGHDVYAVDLRGFGLSPGHPRHDTRVIANAALVARVVAQVIERQVVLVGNSMGGMISAMVAARRPDLLRRLVLVDPALPMVRTRFDPMVTASLLAFTIPGAGETVMRRARSKVSPQVAARQLIDLCFADPTRVSREIIDDAMELTARRERPDAGLGNLERSFLIATRSMLAVLLRRAPYGRLLDGIPTPTLLIHGDRDRLVDVGSARAASVERPGWTYVELSGVGHTPQLEVPEIFVETVESWLKSPRLDERRV